MQNNNCSKLKKLLKLMLQVLPCVFWILLIFGFDLPYIAVITLICALIHELGHIVALCIMCGGFNLKTVANGLRLRAAPQISYKNEIIISAAGPVANLLMFTVLFPFYSYNEYLLSFGVINFMTAISNLLPIESYDGYRIISSSALLLGLGDGWINMLKKISFILISLFSFTALYFMKKLDAGYWIFFIFVAILIKTIKNDKNVFFARKNEKK